VKFEPSKQLLGALGHKPRGCVGFGKRTRAFPASLPFLAFLARMRGVRVC
jgi:hypothetical protein